MATAQIILLTLRQLAGARRLIIVGAIAALPAVLSIYARQTGGAAGGEDFANAIADGLIAALVMPIVTMTMATAAFGNEMEDRTLSFIALQPIARWKTALAKLAAPSLIAVPLVTLGAGAAAYAELAGGEGAARTTFAIAAAVAAGSFAYCGVFTWLGLITSRALALALVYVFLWEAAVATFIGGARYLSVRGYALGMMRGLDKEGLSALADRAIELPAAIIGAAAVSLIFYGLTVRRLKRMDIP